MTFKKLASDLHLWMGLISAPVVFFICITGTIIVFGDELIDLSAGDARYVKEVKETRLETEDMISILNNHFPDRRQPSYMVSYRNSERSVRFNSFSQEKGLRMVYMDPYTGEILKDDGTIYFFYVTAHLHHSLLLHKPGEWIIDIATILFLISLITGMVLWWPKNWKKKQRKAALTINYKASGKRLNYDLHKVLGFYTLLFTLLLSVTGLMIAFKPLAAATKNTFGGDASRNVRETFVQAQTDTTKPFVSINSVIDKAFASHPDKTEIQLYTYRLDEWKYYVMNAANKVGLKSAMNAEFIAFDKNTGEPHQMEPELLMNQKVENGYWTLHMGNYMGWFGKILTFLAGLIASSLAVTGFLVWLNKKRG